MITALILAMGLSAQAQMKPSETLYYYNTGLCSSWTFNTGSVGYTCGSYPSNATIPDAKSLFRVLDTMDKKINELETRIQQLEKAAQK